MKAQAQSKATTHSTTLPASSVFQPRTFSRQNTQDESPSFERDGSSLFATYLQRRATNVTDHLGTSSTLPIIQRQENNTGLPDQLKTGIENLSGYALDDVRVHYNSPKPAQLHALAYTQGTDIHVAPRQERHLPHEAWHVVQQKQGRVRPTMQMKGVGINDDGGLEREADVMGGKAAHYETKIIQNREKNQKTNKNQSLGQMLGKPIQRVDKIRLNQTQIKAYKTYEYESKSFVSYGFPKSLEDLLRQAKSFKEFSDFMDNIINQMTLPALGFNAKKFITTELSNYNNNTHTGTPQSSSSSGVWGQSSRSSNAGGRSVPSSSNISSLLNFTRPEPTGVSGTDVANQQAITNITRQARDNELFNIPNAQGNFVVTKRKHVVPPGNTERWELNLCQPTSINPKKIIKFVVHHHPDSKKPDNNLHIKATHNSRNNKTITKQSRIWQACEPSN